MRSPLAVLTPGRRRTAALLAGAAAAALAAAPASANPLGWYEAGSGIPSTVDLQDVAADSGAAVAVGSDSTPGVAALFSRAPGGWQREAVSGLPAVRIHLSDVALSGSAAWAVGTAAGQPLVVRRAAHGWERVYPPGAMQTPRSIALAGASGFIGDTAGQLFSVTDTGAINSAASIGRPASVNGVTLDGAGNGFAVSDGDASQPRVFNLPPLGPLAAPAFMGTDNYGQNLRGVSGTLAIDSTGYWEAGGDGVWRRGALPVSALHDVSSIHDGAGVLDVAAGNSGAAGSVSRRRRGGDWVTDTGVGPAPVRGVAAAAATEIWAVGDNGMVQRFWDPPDAPAPCECPASEAPSPAPPAAPTVTRLPRKAGQPVIYIVEPGLDRPRGESTPKGKPRRRVTPLIRNVGVVVAKRALTIRFRLVAPARVAATAKRAGRVVGRAKRADKRKGRHRLVLRYRGATPPTELRIVVKPLGRNAGA